jgi:4-carboxymuconolactone decarboxylase
MTAVHSDRGALAPPERAVVRLSAALATRSAEAVRAELEAAAEDADPVHVEETLLQSYLFLGYPVALNAFRDWRQLSDRVAPPAAAEDPAQWEARGHAVCRVVYGGQYARLKANVRRLHPNMERWMIAEGYGKVLGRPEMALELRELCIVALLAVLEAPRQLYSHLRGAFHAGATPQRIEATLAEARSIGAPSAAREAREVWRAVQDRKR